MQLKEKLLLTNVFVDNEYLDKYIDLVTTHGVAKREKYSTQKHHILPVAYFKHENLPVDNSASNKVLLTYKDHILAHYYLSFCTQSWLRGKTASAFVILTDMKTYNNEEDLKLDLDRLEEVYKLSSEHRAHNSSIVNKGRPGNGLLGKVFINNGDICKCVPPEEVSLWEEQGFVRGRITSDKARKNLSEWQLGRPKYGLQGKTKTKEHRNNLSKANLGKVYIVNSSLTIEKWFLEGDPLLKEHLESGEWFVGRKPMTSEHCHNISVAKKGKPSGRKGVKCSEEQRILNSVRCKGRIWVHNDSCSKMIYPEELLTYQQQGYVSGRLTWKTKGEEQH